MKNDYIFPSKKICNDVIIFKKHINTFKLTVALVSTDTTSAKTIQRNSKNPVQKRYLSLYGPPYASKKDFVYIENLQYFRSGFSTNVIVRRKKVYGTISKINTTCENKNNDKYAELFLIIQLKKLITPELLTQLMKTPPAHS